MTFINELLMDTIYIDAVLTHPHGITYHIIDEHFSPRQVTLSHSDCEEWAQTGLTLTLLEKLRRENPAIEWLR